jgi:hypothetical protein
MRAIYLTIPQLVYLTRILAQRIEPCPIADNLRRILRTELERPTPSDHTAHPLTSAPTITTRTH